MHCSLFEPHESRNVTYQDAINFLFPLHRFGMKPGLERISSLLHAVGNPQKRLGKVVHIAGTNGKGTVAYSVASIFSSAGFTTGLYTSPHLVSFTERICVNGCRIPESQVAAYCDVLKEEVANRKATFFEVTTAMACMYFAEMQAEVSVIETGMGGRLDATNVVDPDYVIIPSIGKDHTAWLGDTVEKIAAEKAAIIKKGSRVYTAVKDPAALKPIIDRAAAVGATLNVLQDFPEPVVHSATVGELVFSQKARGVDFSKLKSGVTGDFHASNLALAVLAAHDAGIEERSIRKGLLSMRDFGYRARLERLSEKPDLLLDVAHNPDGMEMSVNTLLRFSHAYRNVLVVLGLVRDKDVAEVVRCLKKLTKTVITVNLLSERGLPASELGGMCRNEGFHAIVAETASEALDIVKRTADKDDLVLVTGSFYLAGEVLKLMKR
ncbi:MAG: bifunctional folylpolyglutamate synthase/dihydrofolate synthase [Chlorobium sp.]|nr:bifunctional folylpolyglutamate synthase/dihydrofolate synthase [Chlorobium sp.]